MAQDIGTLIYSRIYIGYYKKENGKEEKTFPERKGETRLVQMRKNKAMLLGSKWTCIVFVEKNRPGCGS